MKPILQFLITTIFLSFFITTADLLSQTSPVPFHIEGYQLESGYHNGNKIPGGEAVNMFTGTVRISNSPWLSLHFSDVNLGEESYLIITSTYDDHWQKLDAVSIKQWNNFSAFFNGSEVEIRLFVAPED